MTVTIVYETHSITTDNETGIATGHLPGELSPRGRELAAELGARRRDDPLAAVYTSDLRRAVQTAETAFAGHPVPIHRDPRLRECDYGHLNGTPVKSLAPHRAAHIATPWPGGESYHDVVDRTVSFLRDLTTRHRPGTRVLLIAHSANRWALDHLLTGTPLAHLVDAPFNWREGWTYRLPPHWEQDTPIRAGRLTLHPLKVTDADEMAEVLSSPTLYTFTGGTPPTADSLRTRYEIQTRGHSPDHTEEWRNWTLRLHSDARAIGTVQATIPTGSSSAEMAWIIGAPWQKQGYAKEATTALTHWLHTRGITTVQAHIHPAHHASMAIATHLGLTPTPRFDHGERLWHGPTPTPPATRPTRW
ncbi:GNAT family N-acetyltransferase [Sphaerisporangium sp. B11E5]|uniref:GNAT family N-acetyltransferase n=1 Tax=Sphaerisporangium sp. B11E5 TaxID=3153563 RepID=UPI00325C6518